MHICFKDLRNIADERRIEVDIPFIEIKDNTYIYSVKDTKGYISFFYDYEDNLCIKYQLEGIMLCPDCYSFEEVEVPFSIEDEDKVALKEDEEGFYFYDNMSLEDFVLFIVLPEVPIMVENPDKKRYYSGDGWTISSEEEYNKHSKEVIDPRLAKLLEYKEE